MQPEIDLSECEQDESKMDRLKSRKLTIGDRIDVLRWWIAIRVISPVRDWIHPDRVKPGLRPALHVAFAGAKITDADIPYGGSEYAVEAAIRNTEAASRPLYFH